MRVMLVWLVKLPEEPVTVTVNVPMAAVLLEVSVSALVLEVLLGLNEAVTPLGRPDADKLTMPLKPFWGVIVIVLVTVAPWRMVRIPGEAKNEKFGPKTGQLFTRLAALTVPIPVAKSQPAVVPYAGLNEVFEVERTPTEPPAK
jgi:hypothetical protein